ncbi:hypothetical protein AYI69_g3311 [Smittium culicis]|uniref:Integrase zinc-binding domain-containing protein n=1 Tax=Smittium culicis TaxID=133412 RepID=A0A1R1YK26_9FUNG|nr:hypothetical protein AYI69_g3311 [Smittium culicis]
MLTSAPIFRPINYNKGTGKIILTVDASPFGAGAVLQQEDKNGIRYVCRDGHIFRRAKADRVPRKVVFDKDEQKVLLENIHTGIGGGHHGRDGTMAKLKDRYFWNKMRMQQFKFKEELSSHAFEKIKESRSIDKERFDNSMRVRKERMEEGSLVLIYDNAIDKSDDKKDWKITKTQRHKS